MIVTLDWEYAPAWTSLYEDFFGSFPWSPIMGERQVQDLLTRTGDTESWVVIEDSDVVAIGSLKAENERRTGIVQNFAFRSTYTHAALDLLKHLASRAKMKNLDKIMLWTWESMVSMLDLMIRAEFQIREKMSLMHANIIDDFVAPKERPRFTIKSLADELSIDEFVAANRLAFAEDKSRLLEKDELEYWIESLPGYQTDLQLAVLENNRIVGTVMSEYEEIQSGNSRFTRAWVYGLGVVPDARRRGVATYLIAELARRLRAYGVHDIWLLTDLDGPVRAFYESIGFHCQTVYIEFVSNL